MMKLLWLSILFTSAYALLDFSCTAELCKYLKRVKCVTVNVTSCEGIVTSGVGICGCCDQCVAFPKEGEKCAHNLNRVGICDKGLVCVSQVCRNTIEERDLNAPCAAKLAEINARLSNDTDHLLLGLERPRCEDDGTYKPYQFGGSQAICVTADGTRLYDYMVYRWEAGDMDCQCARDQYAYKQTGMIGKMFYCYKNGNYASVGCTGSVCYCQDKLGKQVGTSTVSISEKDSMNC